MRTKRAATDKGRASACSALATLYVLGQGVTKDLSRAEQLFEKACKDDEAGGCGGSARLKYDRRDFVAAFGIAERACKLNDRDGCRLVANMLTRGEGTARNPARAVSLLDSGCNAGDMRSCLGLATMYGVGVGVPLDPMRANALATKACEGGVTAACRTGSADPISRQELPAEIQTACEAKDPNACIVLGGILFGRGEFANAAPALQVACASGHPWSCSQLATAYLLGGRGVPKDPKRARELFQKACADMDKSACEAMKLLH